METKEITKAIIEVMKEVQIIGKNTTVGSGNNSYKATSDRDVKETIRSSMEKNGLVIAPIGLKETIQVDRWEEEDNWSKSTPKAMKTKQSVFTQVNTKYILLHTSGESIELAGYGQGIDSQDKGAGKATTYALKNVLLNLFLIPTGEDTDNTHSEDIKTPPKKSDTKQFYNDTEKHIDAWRDAVSDGKTTGKAILKKITVTDGLSINGKDKKLILDLDNK